MEGLTGDRLVVGGRMTVGGEIMVSTLKFFSSVAVEVLSEKHCST